MSRARMRTGSTTARRGPRRNPGLAADAGARRQPPRACPAASADLVVGPSGLRFAGRRFACVVGRGGVTQAKREGDAATPAGVHRIVGMLYRPDRIGAPAGWARSIGPRDLWSDDPADPDYNRAVRAPHPFGHERLRRADRLYDLVLLTDWNWPDARRGAGSAIFVHRWRRPGVPTSGCVALHPCDLLWIARRINRQSRLIVR